MDIWLVYWLLYLVVGIALLLPAYASLIGGLRRHHPDVYDRIGRPTLFMLGPGRSLRLQRFIYRRSAHAELQPRVRRRIAFVAWATPLFVIGVFLFIGWAMRSGFGNW